MNNTQNPQLSNPIISLRSWQSQVIPVTGYSNTIISAVNPGMLSSVIPGTNFQVSPIPSLTSVESRMTPLLNSPNTILQGLLAPTVKVEGKPLPPTTTYLETTGNTTKKRKYLPPSVMKSKALVQEHLLPKTCAICAKVCANSEKLKRHMRCHPEKLMQCDQCPKKFKHNYTLTDHKNRMHSLSPKPPVEHSFSKCKICGQTYRMNYIERHMIIHTQNYKHKCDECDRGFTSLSKLNRHRMIEHEGLRYNCAKCQAVFKCKDHFKRHMQEHTDEQNNEGQRFKCEMCPRSFYSQASVDRHKRYHNMKQVCELCGKTLSTILSYKAHMNIHNNETPFPCDVCKKAFRSKSRLKVHVRIHTKEKPYKCKECSKSFSQASSLKVHMRGHTGEKPYQCDICQKRFITKTLLKYHIRKHGNS